MNMRYAIGGMMAATFPMRALRFVQGQPEDYIRVIMYHDVPPASMKALRSQLQFIHDKYGFVDPHNFRKGPTTDKQKGIRVLLTFDDGFKSNKVVADEILKPLGIKAVFFIPSLLLELRDREAQRQYIANHIFKRRTLNSLPEEMALMNEGDFRELISDGHIIGAHTRNHRMLSEIQTEKELRDEIINSGDLLERRLGVAIEWFAWPFGYLSAINAQAYRIICERYKYCCSGVRGINPQGFNPKCILRDPVDLDCSNSYLRFLIEDGLGLFYRKQVQQLHSMVP